MKYLLLPVLLIVLHATTYAQKEANNWYFGNKLGINFGEGCPNLFTEGEMLTYGGSAVMSDKNTGELLFYTNGRTIWNRNHQPMPNGGYTSVDCTTGLGQPALIVPVPESTHLYYVFHLNFRSYPEGEKMYQLCGSVPVRAYSLDVLYSVVNMQLNGGLGDVISTQKDILLQTKATEKLTAIPHNNGRDYWLITHEWDSDAFVVHLITLEGIAGPMVQHIGSIHRQRPYHDNQEIRGMMKASPNGKKLAVAVHGEARPLDLFDFDAATGRLSNYVTLGNLLHQFGVSFSPDNSKLYVTHVSLDLPNGVYYPDDIQQFDLLAGDTEAIIASARSIIVDNPSANRPAERWIGGFNDMQLAPDGKIYMISTNWHIDLPEYADNHAIIIHNPNKKGFDSKVSYTTLNFGGKTIDSGLPNFIQSYFNGLEPVFCTPADECALFSLTVHPNPTTGKVRFAIEETCATDQKFSITIVNNIGQKVAGKFEGLNINDEVDLSTYADGIYLFIFIFPDHKRMVKKVVKVT